MTASKHSSDMATTIALLPLGATEQHGPHLPFETDTIIADAIARRAAALAGDELAIDLLPAEPVGYSVEHMDFPGSRTLGFAQAAERWIDIGRQQAARGVRRMVLLNAHGGNSPILTIVATELRVRHAMLAVATSWPRFGYPEGIVSEAERAYGIHAGFVETSLMLALRPDLVAMDKAQAFASRQQDHAARFTHLRAYGPHAFGWKMADLNSAGAVGDAAGANAQAGRAILDHAAQGLAALLQDVARFDVSSLS